MKDDGAPTPVALRASIAVPIALLVFVLLHGALGIGRDTTPRIHSLRNAAACAECHAEGSTSTLRAALPGLCTRCHAELAADCTPPGEPGAEGCTTCHDPHGKSDRVPATRGTDLDGPNPER